MILIARGEWFSFLFFFWFFLVSFVRMSEIMHLICCMCTIQIYFGRSVECCGDGYKTQNLMLLS